MENNQNTQRNPPTDNKSPQELITDDKKKTEINPNNPTATQNTQDKAQPGNKPSPGASTQQGNTETKDQSKGSQEKDSPATDTGNQRQDGKTEFKTVTQGNK